VNVGQTVVASLNAPSLFLLAKDLTRMQVWASVNEADIGRIHPGMHVHFTVDAYPDETFEGDVAQIRLNATMTQNVVTYTVVVATKNEDGKLLPYPDGERSVRDRLPQGRPAGAQRGPAMETETVASGPRHSRRGPVRLLRQGRRQRRARLRQRRCRFRQVAGDPKSADDPKSAGDPKVHRAIRNRWTTRSRPAASKRL